MYVGPMGSNPSPSAPSSQGSGNTTATPAAGGLAPAATTKPLHDKREGACQNGPCRLPHRCWQHNECFLYGEPEEGSVVATKRS